MKSGTDYNEHIASIYANRNNKDTGFIAYRDLPNILQKHATGLKALDYGCGTGFSSFIMAEQGYEVVGLDINQNMLNEAKNKFPHIKFYHLDENTAPQALPFDSILCAFVLLELSSVEQMIAVIKNLRRMIKSTGKLFILTTSEYFPKNDWLTGKNDLSANSSIVSGQQYHVVDTSSDMTFTDYYYDDKTYRSVLNQGGFMVDELYQPLGKESDKIEWTTEWNLPPYSIYVCSPVE